MYLILKPEYKVIFEDDKAYFFNVFTKKSFQTEATEKIDWILLQELCYRGSSIDFLKNHNIYTLNFMIYLLKTKRHIFTLSESNIDIKKTINCRSVIDLGMKVGCPEGILKRYVELYEETTFVVIGDINDSLKEFLHLNGLRCKIELGQNEGQRQIVIINKDHHLGNIFSENENIIVLPYSVARMTLGPCDFELKKQNFRFQQEDAETISNIASFANIASLYSVLMNCLLYLIGDIHEVLYIDAGLPFQREFKFHLPSLELTAIPVYKGGK